MKTREIEHIINAMPSHDGAGVKLLRSVGARPGLRLDPFLMLDEFFSDDAADYIGGFPSHPHRGFQTVTYMLNGHMLHEDHMGNRGDLRPGDVQWMVAGRGIIHSEMPQQKEGRMRGFQLWLNLPASEKMQPPSYRDIPAGDIPQAALPDGGYIKVIAGEMPVGDAVVQGPIQGVTTDPVYADIHLPADVSLTVPLEQGHTAFLYVYEGSLRVAERELTRHQVGVLDDGDGISVQVGPEGAQFLLLAARPLGEPVVQYGPFVMNTREEIEQAIEDYSTGRLTAA